MHTTTPKPPTPPNSWYPPIPEDLWTQYDAQYSTTRTLLSKTERRIQELKAHPVSEYAVVYWTEKIQIAERKFTWAEYRMNNAECAAGLAREKGGSEFLERAMRELGAARDEVDGMRFDELIFRYGKEEGKKSHSWIPGRSKQK